MAVFGHSSVEKGEAEEKGRGKEGLRTTFIFRSSHTEGETRQQIGGSQLTHPPLKHSASVVSVFDGASSALSLQFQFRSTHSVPMEPVLGRCSDPPRLSPCHLLSFTFSKIIRRQWRRFSTEFNPDPLLLNLRYLINFLFAKLIRCRTADVGGVGTLFRPTTTFPLVLSY